MKRTAPIAIFLTAVLSAALLVSCSGRTPTELTTRDITLGNGEEAVNGADLTVHYTGWLYKNGRRGKKFDSSEGGEPLSFKLGAGEVIEGWDQGIAGMRVGGRREIIIPPELAYGAEGAPPEIPPNAALNFEVQLLAVKK